MKKLSVKKKIAVYLLIAIVVGGIIYSLSKSNLFKSKETIADDDAFQRIKAVIQSEDKEASFWVLDIYEERFKTNPLYVRDKPSKAYTLAQVVREINPNPKGARMQNGGIKSIFSEATLKAIWDIQENFRHS